MSEKVKHFLTNKQVAYEKKIKKLKKRNLIVKIIYINSIIISISSSVIIGTLTPIVGLPMTAVSILGLSGALSTALSTKFNMKRKKEKLEQTINNLNKIKNKLEYILSCNGDITDEQYKLILEEFENI